MNSAQSRHTAGQQLPPSEQTPSVEPQEHTPLGPRDFATFGLKTSGLGTFGLWTTGEVAMIAGGSGLAAIL